MNYLMAMAITLMGTMLAALGDSKNVYWLLVSDANVALGLFFAWFFERRAR